MPIRPSVFYLHIYKSYSLLSGEKKILIIRIDLNIDLFTISKDELKVNKTLSNKTIVTSFRKVKTFIIDNPCHFSILQNHVPTTS